MTDRPDTPDRAALFQYGQLSYGVRCLRHNLRVSTLHCDVCVSEVRDLRAAPTAEREALERLIARLLCDSREAPMSTEDAKKCDADSLCSLVFAYERFLSLVRKHPDNAEWVRELDDDRDRFVRAALAREGTDA